MPVMACPRCGHVRDVTEDSPYCPRCGQLVQVPQAGAPGSSPSLPVAGASGIRPPGASGIHPTIGAGGIRPAAGSGIHAVAAGSGVRQIPLNAPPPSSPGMPVPQPTAHSDVPPTPQPANEEHLVRRLKVIDGADQGHSFLVADQGVTTVGSNSKHAEVCLHDLYVARVHCQLEVEDDHLVVTSCGDSSRPTFINGQQIQQSALAPGDVLRVGNSYLRLELEVAEARQTGRTGSGSAAATATGPVKTPRLPLNRLGELAGQMVGHFQLEKVLGSGHHGVVFRARDLKTEQEVALKVFSPDFPANDAEMQEFIQAMRTALPLRHASLVAVNGAGKSGPYVWLSRELVSGLSLAQIMHPSGKSREGLDWRLALRVAVHVGQALELVHRQHLIHSNVTPQNILIVGNEGQVKLNDLMVRKALDRTALGQSVAEQKFLADLPYMAPEQTDPDAFVDNLCDVYSLGVVVYALMTGRLPFRGKTPEEILDQIRTAIPAKPKKFERSIPSRFQEVVLKMMAKKQEDRYPTPTDLLADLDSIAKERDVPV